MIFAAEPFGHNWRNTPPQVYFAALYAIEKRSRETLINPAHETSHVREVGVRSCRKLISISLRKEEVATYQIDPDVRFSNAGDTFQCHQNLPFSEVFIAGNVIAYC